MTGDIIKDCEVAISQCLTASGPSRYIDGLIEALVHNRTLVEGTYHAGGKCLLARNSRAPHDEYVVWAESADRDFNVPRYTASIDACTTALKNRYPGVIWQKRIDGTVTLQRAAEHSFVFVGGFATAATVELSFCLALASARVALTRDVTDSRPATAIYDRELDDLDRECLMTVEAYLESVESGGFIDDDGWGFPVKDGRKAVGDDGKGIVGDYGLRPSEGTSKLPADASHVVWYNS